MNRIDRLSAILIHLQSKKVIKAQEIADRFEISLRTVYRDLKALESAGVPLGAEAGLGYYILEGYSLPPVSFSKEEAGALLMAAKLAERQTDKSIKKHLTDALYKIRSALRLDEKEYMESIENNIEVLHLAEQVGSASFPDHFLSDIQSALAQKKVINFDYYSQNSDQFTNRDVQPLSLCFYSRHWHLIGYCKLREGLRDFRSDRIMKLKITSEEFNSKDLPEYQSYLDTMINTSDLQEVHIQFSTTAARYVVEQRYFMGYTESEKSGSFELMKFMTSDLISFAHWLMQFIDEVTVVQPETLSKKLKQLAKRLYKHYQ